MGRGSISINRIWVPFAFGSIVFWLVAVLCHNFISLVKDTPVIASRVHAISVLLLYQDPSLATS